MLISSLLKSISGITVALYYSEANYSVTLRSTIASCMTGVRAADVSVLNVSALLTSSRRLGGLRLTSEAATTGITATYGVTAKAKVGQDSLQQQLLSASSSGFFDAQLSLFSTRYATPGFQNASSLGVIVLTAAPSPAPTTNFIPPTQQPSITLIPGLDQVIQCIASIVT